MVFQRPIELFQIGWTIREIWTWKEISMFPGIMCRWLDSLIGQLSLNTYCIKIRDMSKYLIKDSLCSSEKVCEWSCVIRFSISDIWEWYSSSLADPILGRWVEKFFLAYFTTPKTLSTGTFVGSTVSSPRSSFICKNVWRNGIICPRICKLISFVLLRMSRLSSWTSRNKSRK